MILVPVNYLGIPDVFILDDGSSTCFCWANAERAATLLRLREELPQTVLEYCGCTLKWVGIDKTARGSIMYHLGRILEKHKRITVKTHGSMADSSFPELTVFASSDNKLTSSDENLLKFIVLHACFCISWVSLDSLLKILWSKFIVFKCIEAKFCIKTVGDGVKIKWIN